MIFTVSSNKATEYFALFSSIFLIGLIISDPGTCAGAAKKGISLCGEAIIPTLFPFAVPVLFIINTTVFKNCGHKTALVFLLSLAGGYPVGAKLISELYKNDRIDRETAQKMLPLCVNAGPAFTVIAVGKILLNNIALGYILLASLTISALMLVLVFLPEILKKSNPDTSPAPEANVADNLVFSIGNASNATVSVCAFVIIFSVINEYIVTFSARFSAFAPLVYFTEITSAVKSAKNVYFISFLLGFAGISIWAQVYSVSGKIKPKLIKFLCVRLLHGILSAAITLLLVKISGIGVPAITAGTSEGQKIFVSDYSLSVSLVIMALLLIVSISGKKYSGNIIKDML